MRFFSPYFATIVNHWDCRFLQVAAHHELADAQTPAAALPGKGEAVAAAAALQSKGRGSAWPGKGVGPHVPQTSTAALQKGEAAPVPPEVTEAQLLEAAISNAPPISLGHVFQFSRIGPHPSDEGSLQAIFSSSAPAPGHSADIGIYRRRPGRPGIQSDSER